MVVHNISSIYAIAIGEKFILGLAGVNKDYIHISIGCNLQGFARSNSNDIHTAVESFLKRGIQSLEKTGVFDTGGTGDLQSLDSQAQGSTGGD
jgi:hypothetical protein